MKRPKLNEIPIKEAMAGILEVRRRHNDGNQFIL